jgi:iron complex outermembrane receptor protein
VSLSAFHNRYDDLLSVDSRPTFTESSPPLARSVLPLDLRNGVRAATSGVEMHSVWDLRKWWRLQGSYSFMGLDARNKPSSNDASSVRQLEGDTPAHKAVAQSSFTIPRGFELDLMWRYVSEVPNQRVPAYSTADIRFARRVSHNFDVAVVGQNLLQPHHLEYGGIPGPLVRIRRSAYLKLSWTR